MSNSLRLPSGDKHPTPTNMMKKKNDRRTYILYIVLLQRIFYHRSRSCYVQDAPCVMKFSSTRTLITAISDRTLNTHSQKILHADSTNAGSRVHRTHGRSKLTTKCLKKERKILTQKQGTLDARPPYSKRSTPILRMSQLKFTWKTSSWPHDHIGNA